MQVKFSAAEIAEAYAESKKDWMMFFLWGEHPGFSPDDIVSAPIPEELPSDLEQEAHQRAQLAAFITMIAVPEGNVKRWELFPKILLAPILRVNLELVNPDLSFVCRVLYLAGLYKHCRLEFTSDWQMRLNAYFKSAWPEYQHQPVTQEVLDQWHMLPS